MAVTAGGGLGARSTQGAAQDPQEEPRCLLEGSASWFQVCIPAQSASPGVLTGDLLGARVPICFLQLPADLGAPDAPP